MSIHRTKSTYSKLKLESFKFIFDTKQKYSNIMKNEILKVKKKVQLPLKLQVPPLIQIFISTLF